MYCRKCGARNDDNAYKCVSCGEILQQVPPPMPSMSPQVPIPNYLAQSILVTLFCCLPMGIVAIVYSAQVNGKIQAGDIAGALETSKKAKMWGWISFGCGIAFGVLYMLLVVMGTAMEPPSGY